MRIRLPRIGNLVSRVMGRGEGLEGMGRGRNVRGVGTRGGGGGGEWGTLAEWGSRVSRASGDNNKVY